MSPMRLLLIAGTVLSGLPAMVLSLEGEKDSGELPARLEVLAPKMLSWFNDVESHLLGAGRSLTDLEQAMARSLGVNHPERVRVVVTESFPMPPDPGLRKEAQRLGFDTLPEGGRAMGYAILLLPGEVNKVTTLAHELVHVAQMERLGREEFLRRYFASVDEVGYARSPFENEARSKTERYLERVQ